MIRVTINLVDLIRATIDLDLIRVTIDLNLIRVAVNLDVFRVTIDLDVKRNDHAIIVSLSLLHVYHFLIILCPGDECELSVNGKRI